MAQNKGISAFWKIYIAIAALLFIALGVWLVFLYGWLEDHEAAQPKYAAEDAFELEFKVFDPVKFVEKHKVDEELGIPKEMLVEYLKSITDGKELTYKKTSSSTKNTHKYVVLAGEGEDAKKVGNIELVEVKGKKGQFNTNYSIYIEESYFYNNTVNATIPKGYTLKINGEAVDAKFIVEDNIETESCRFMPEGVEGLMYTRYKVERLLKDPVVEVFDKNGNAVPHQVDEDGNYNATVPYDTALQEQYGEWIIEGAILYSRYTQFDEKINTVYFNQVAPWFDPSSELYESIRTMENGFVVYYDDFEFTDTGATEFIKYDDNTFSCHVQLTQKMYKNVAGGREEYVDYIDFNLYLRRVDDKFLVYEMKVN